MNPPPPWLETFQSVFSQMLRTPLTRSRGALASSPQAFPAELCDATRAHPRSPASERLAVYNRQYWLRLLNTMQTAFPLTTALLGARRFNIIALAFLRANEPRHRDLARIADGFAAFLVDAAPSEHAVNSNQLPWRAVAQGSQIDAAFGDIRSAPEELPFSAAGLSQDALGGSRLVLARNVRLVEEDWALLGARREHAARPAPETPRAPPPRHAARRFFALQQVALGPRVVRLAPLQARLYARLTDATVAEALARLEAECSPEQRAHLLQRVGDWLAFGVEYGLWVGSAP